MSKQEIVKIFGDRKIRSVWDDQAEEWYFSVIDVIAVVTESDNPRKYWSVLKTRLKKEGNETATNCSQLKLNAEDGKMRLTDVMTAEQMFRIIQPRWMQMRQITTSYVLARPAETGRRQCRFSRLRSSDFRSTTGE